MGHRGGEKARAETERVAPTSGPGASERGGRRASGCWLLGAQAALGRAGRSELACADLLGRAGGGGPSALGGPGQRGGRRMGRERGRGKEGWAGPA